MAKGTRKALAKSLGFTKATRMVNVLNAGYQNKSTTGATRSNGYVVELELPLFGLRLCPPWHAAEHDPTCRPVHRTAQVAVDARSEVRESYSAYRTAYRPRGSTIATRCAVCANGFRKKTCFATTDAQQRLRPPRRLPRPEASVTGYVESVRDFWVAQTNLQTALTGRSPECAGLWIRLAHRRHGFIRWRSALKETQHDQSQKLLHRPPARRCSVLQQ